MNDAGASSQVVTYPRAKHGFTNLAAGDAGMAGLAYDAQADREWRKAARRMARGVQRRSRASTEQRGWDPATTASGRLAGG